MALIQKYTPTLRDLVKIDSLPENLGFLQDSLGNILDKIYYKNPQIFKSSSGNSISYNLDLILYKKLVLFEIPGTG